MLVVLLTNSDKLSFCFEEVNRDKGREYQINNSYRNHSKTEAKAGHNDHYNECPSIRKARRQIKENKCVNFIDILGKSIHDSATGDEVVEFSEWSPKQFEHDGFVEIAG